MERMCSRWGSRGGSGESTSLPPEPGAPCGGVATLHYSGRHDPHVETHSTLGTEHLQEPKRRASRKEVEGDEGEGVADADRHVDAITSLCGRASPPPPPPAPSPSTPPASAPPNLKSLNRTETADHHLMPQSKPSNSWGMTSSDGSVHGRGSSYLQLQ